MSWPGAAGLGLMVGDPLRLRVGQRAGEADHQPGSSVGPHVVADILQLQDQTAPVPPGKDRVVGQRLAPSVTSANPTAATMPSNTIQIVVGLSPCR